MKEHFADILSLTGVHGVLFLSGGAEVLFARFRSARFTPPDDMDWKGLVAAIKRLREVDIVYEKLRIYLRRSESGHLLVVADPKVSGAMLRLNCDIVLPSLKRVGSGGTLKRFFKKSAH